MKIQEVFETLQKRLTKKLARARLAFLKENTIKKTHNCVNKGRNLAGEIYHCKINALGSHELGASQCWDEKACLCPYFELKYSLEQLDRQFQKMDLEELGVRWPSIGELIRVQDLLKQVDEIKNHGQDIQRSLHSEKPDHLQAPSTEKTGGSESGVSGIDQHGLSGISTSENSIPESSGRDDQGCSDLDETVRERMPLAVTPGLRDW
jgi:hypothetical protein